MDRKHSSRDENTPPARDLAYRLYTICERKEWADEALAYNGLVIAWPELTPGAVLPLISAEGYIW